MSVPDCLPALPALPALPMCLQVLEEADSQTRDGRLDPYEFAAAFAWHAIVDHEEDYARARRRRRRTERRVLHKVRLLPDLYSFR